MKRDFECKNIACLRWNIRQVKSQEQTQEVKLPDGMPNIGSILGAWGQCVLRGKEWRKGEISINGGVVAWVLYLPMDGGTPESLEVWVPFQEKWELDNCEREGTIRTQCRLKSLDARMLSERKLIIRAGLGLLAEAMEPWDAAIYTQQDLPSDVQLLQHSYPVRIPIEAGERSFILDEEIELPQAGKLMYCSVQPKDVQQQVVGNKLSLWGQAHCHLFFETEDGVLQNHDAEIEFSQLADLDQDYDKDTTASVDVELSSLEAELQEGRLRLKCGVVGQYLIWEKKVLDLTEDAYSPMRPVSVMNEQVQIPAVLDQNLQTLQPEVALNVPCNQVVDTLVLADQPSLRRSGNQMQMELTGSVQVLYYDKDGQLRCSNGRWNAPWEMPSESSVQINGRVVYVEQPKAVCTGDQLLMTAPVQVEAVCLSHQSMEMVAGVELGEITTPDPKRPSILLRRKGDQSLWELAKESGSTVEAIQAANGLMDEHREGQLLLIPVL